MRASAGLLFLTEYSLDTVAPGTYVHRHANREASVERMRTDNPVITMTGFVASAGFADTGIAGIADTGIGFSPDTPVRRRLH